MPPVWVIQFSQKARVGNVCLPVKLAETTPRTQTFEIGDPVNPGARTQHSGRGPKLVPP